MKFDSGVTVALSSIVLGALFFFGLGKGEKNDGGYSAKEATAFKILKQRPVNLPNLATSGPCPITHGNRSTVPKVDYIFCSGCFWFGKGPTFLAFSWSDQSTDEARFSVARIPYEKHAYRAKTPFVSKPEYSGPILIRGRGLSGTNEKLRFGSAGLVNDALELSAPTRERANDSRWSFWPTSIFVPRAGCYGLQIDTTNASDVVIFETTGPR